MVLLNVASASATRSIEIKPPEKYTVFQNDTPAIFYCYGNGFGTGAVVSWSLNGTGYGTEYAQMGITYVIDPPTEDTVSSRLIVPSNSTINNNTQVVCRAADVTFSIVLTSLPTNLTIQGPLQFPSNFFVNISNTSNTTFLLSWDAPFSLDVTDSPDIYYYTLCTNITIYGFDFTGNSLNATSGGQNRTIMDYVDPIHFTFFAVNGAGNGSKANLTYLFKKDTTNVTQPAIIIPNLMFSGKRQRGKTVRRGGLVILRHNEICDCIDDLASQVWPQVIKEPIVNETTATSSDPGLRLDLGIRGVWQPQVEALFDIRVIDTDAPSHCHRAPNAILESSSQEKKRIYKKAVEDRRGTFTPFVLSVDGLLHKEASHFIKHMATALSSEWDKAYSITSSYIRSRLAFAGVQAVSLCLRRSRTKWRSGLGFDDGAPLASFME
eukprot:Em0001g3054a